jgi:hypothetical protein
MAAKRITRVLLSGPTDRWAHAFSQWRQGKTSSSHVACLAKVASRREESLFLFQQQILSTGNHEETSKRKECVSPAQQGVSIWTRRLRPAKFCIELDSSREGSTDGSSVVTFLKGLPPKSRNLDNPFLRYGSGRWNLGATRNDNTSLLERGGLTGGVNGRPTGISTFTSLRLLSFPRPFRSLHCSRASSYFRSMPAILRLFNTRKTSFPVPHQYEQHNRAGMSTFSGSTWEEDGDLIILKRRPAKEPDASSSNWMGFTKKRNLMLETALEKVVAVKGKDEVEDVLEKLQTKWCKNGASATGRMIYVLKRLVEEEDVERSVVVRMFWVILYSFLDL